MGDLTPANLEIAGSSLLEEVAEQIVARAAEHFADDNVIVDQYYNDLSPDNLEDLHNRCLQSIQVLFTFFAVTPDPSQTRNRAAKTQKDENLFGFYVCHSVARKDDGRHNIFSVYRVIERLRRLFSNYKVTVTVDRNTSDENTFGLRQGPIERMQQIPYVSVYRVTWTMDSTMNLSFTPTP